MNSKAASLHSFDDQFKGWMKSTKAPANHPVVSAADETLAELTLLWPSLLKILVDATQDYGSWPTWLRYAILTADRLLLSSRSIPLQQQEIRVKAALKQIADIESQTTELIAAQIADEKAKFFSQYGTFESDVHKATDYWPIWEERIRQLASSTLQEKLSQLRIELISEQAYVAELDSQQIQLRDKWSSLRSRLVAADTLGVAPEQSWWGSLRNPTSITEPLREWVEMPILLEKSSILSFQDSLRRMQLAASMHNPESDLTWQNLRLSLNRLSDLSLASPATSEVGAAALNVVDALLNLVYFRDECQFSEKQRSLVRELELRKVGLENSEDFLRDPVVSKFVADARQELIDAALAKLKSAYLRKGKEAEEKRNLEISSINNQLRQLKSSRAQSFSDPWEALFGDWKKLTRN